MKTFAVAAQAGSFTLAGESLHVTQGAVSRQIKLLEDSLGVPLFVREHQKVQLTAQGRELAASLQRIFGEMESAVRKASGEAQQEMLSVNLPPTFATRWLAPRLSDFRARYPHVDLSITTERMPQPRDARAYDCGVIFGEVPWPRMLCEPILRERHIMVSSPALWQRGKPPALQNSTLLHVLDGDARLPVWEHWLEVHGPRGIDARPGLNFSTLDQAINAAASGAGVVVVDEVMIVRELQSKTLLRHSALELDGPCGYWFVSNPQRPESAERVKIFRDWLLGQARGTGSHNFE